MKHSTTTHKDRSAGLMIFGVLEILAGGLVLGLVVNAGRLPIMTLVERTVISVILAAMLVPLGIGSIKAQRWARTLSLILASVTLLLSPYIAGRIIWMLPQSFSMAGTVALLAVVSAAGVFFYGNKHVKATCEARHPEPDWTDACPLPVLGISLFVTVSGANSLLSGLLETGVFLLFNIFVALAGLVVVLVPYAVWFYSAWKMYRLNISGWHIQTVCVPILAAFCLLKNMLDDELSPDLQEFVKITSQEPAPAWMILIFFAFWFGCLLWIEKYFHAKPAADSENFQKSPK